MKKAIATLLAVMMVLGVVTATIAFADVNVTAKGFTVPPEMTVDGIDWNAVAAHENGDFAMLCAYNAEPDSGFEANYQAAKAAGVQVGAYLVMKATTVEEAQADAIGMLKAIAGKQFELPICVQLPDIASANLVELVLETMEKLSEGGSMYLTVFVTADFANQNPTVMSDLGSYDTWFTEANASVTATDIADPSYGGYYHICEYAYGQVDGVEGTVALDYVKDYDFLAIMQRANLNGYGTSSIVAPVEPPVNDPLEPPVDNPVEPPVDNPVEPPVEDPDDTVTDTNTPDVTPTDVLFGDVNGDIKVDAKDALMVLKYTVAKIDLTEVEKKAAEVDGKEGINAKDALEILKFTVKKITKFPIEQ